MLILAYAASLSVCNAFGRRCRIGDEFVEPAPSACNGCDQRRSCCCHPVAFITAAIVVPDGDRSIARTRDCFELGSGFLALGSSAITPAGFAGAADADGAARGCFAGLDI